LKNRIGETQIANNGQLMTIIAYRRSEDIDIQFEDGTIVYNKSFANFKNGQVKNPNCLTAHCFHKLGNVGDTSISKDGQKMEVIAYNSSEKIDVKFEDGTIVKNQNYPAFIRGYIKNPNLEEPQKYQYINRVGETTFATNGQQMKIIACRNCKDLDIEFEDGTIVKHQRYKRFQMGYVTNPNCKKSKKTGKNSN
jgi:hypothetical protein